MRLVHRQQGDRQTPRQLRKAVGLQTLGRDVQQLIHAPPDIVVHPRKLLAGQRAVDIRRRHARVFQRHHLILHQGNQRRHDHRHPRQQQGGDLVAEAFPAAGRHDAQHVAPVQHRVDQPLLPAAEGRIAEMVLQNRIFIHRVPPPLCKNTCFRLHFSTNPAVFQYGPHTPPTKPAAAVANGNGPRRRGDAPARAPKRLSAAKGKPRLCGHTNRAPSGRNSSTAGRRDRLAEERGSSLPSADGCPPPVCGGHLFCRPPAYSRQKKRPIMRLFRPPFPLRLQ